MLIDEMLIEPRNATQRCQYGVFEIEFVHVTPELAELWLGANVHNRSLNMAHVARLAQDMKANAWEFDSSTIKFDIHGVLLDGQHRLTAIKASGRTVLMLVARGISPTSQDVVDTGRKRLAGDMFTLAGFKHASYIASTAKMVKFWQSGEIKNTGSRLHGGMSNAVLRDLEEADPRIAWAVGVARERGAGIPAKPTSIAFFAWLAGGVDSDGVIEFITALAEIRTDGLGDPRATLLKRLQEMRTERKRADNVLEAFMFVRCWNAFRKGERLTAIRTTANDKPIPFPQPV